MSGLWADHQGKSSTRFRTRRRSELIGFSVCLRVIDCRLRIVAYESLRTVAYETLPLVSYQSSHTSCLAALDRLASVCFPNDFIYLPLNHSLSVRLIQRLKFNGSQVMASHSTRAFEVNNTTSLKNETFGATTELARSIEWQDKCSVSKLPRLNEVTNQFMKN